MYKRQIGVSGDGVDQDEDVAEAGGSYPTAVIRIDCVLGIEGAYTTSAAPCPGAEGQAAATPAA